MGPPTPCPRRKRCINADGEDFELHPAALVFRGEVLASVVEENRRLADEISRLQPLLRFVQEVELMATVNEEAIRLVEQDHNGSTVWTPGARAERRVVATLLLKDGSIVDRDEGGELVMSVEKCSHRLLLENLGSVGGMGVRMSSKKAWFPRGFFFGRGSTNVCVAEDGTISLSISIDDELSIRGHIEGLSNEDLANFKEGRYDGNRLDVYFMAPRLPHITILESPDATFVPSAIVIKASPSLKETLDLVERATSESTEGLSIEMSPSQELFASTIAALGDNEHKLLLETTLLLKVQRDALQDLRAKVMRVAITHESESLRFSLDEGEVATDNEGALVWCVNLDGKESCMTLKNIGASVLSLSGSPVNGLGLSENLHLVGLDPMPVVFMTHFEGEVAVMLPYYFGSESMKVEVIASCNFGDFSAEEIEDIMDGFVAKVFSAVVGGMMSLGLPTFPDTFKVSLKQARFYPSGNMKKLLDLVGLGDGLESTCVDKESDE